MAAVRQRLGSGTRALTRPAISRAGCATACPQRYLLFVTTAHRSKSLYGEQDVAGSTPERPRRDTPTGPDPEDWTADPPREVHVTLLPNPDAEPLLERVRLPPPARAGLKVVIGLLAAGLAAFVATGLPGDRATRAPPRAAASTRSPIFRHTAAAARRPGAPGVAASYGYPLACLSVTIDQADRAYARADFNHGSECGRYDGDVTAIFHRVDGVWRPMLDATGYSCPNALLSAAVQAALDVCP